MLKKCLGNYVENWCWKKCLGNCLENWFLKKCLGNCVENRCWKKWLEKCVVNWCWKKTPGELCENCRESDKKTAVSRIQCYKPQVEKTKVQASVGLQWIFLHICCGLKYDSSSNIHQRQQLIKFLPQPAAACLPFPFPLKLLHALSHFDELSRFVCFDVCCEMSLFTRFDTFWWNVAIYALWRMSAKCRDLRTLPGTKFRLPGTFNYSAPLHTVSHTHRSPECTDNIWRKRWR